MTTPMINIWPAPDIVAKPKKLAGEQWSAMRRTGMLQSLKGYPSIQ